MGSSGWNSFYKTATDESGGNYAGTLISQYPVRPGAVTSVTVYFETGNTFHLSVGKKNIPKLQSIGNPYFIPENVGIWGPSGTKYTNQNHIPYTAPFYEGDNVTMTIDLRPYKNCVSYAKNGLDLGIAFQGLGEWGTDIYIMLFLYGKNTRLKIIDYRVLE